MPRTRGGVVHARKRKRILKRASGFVGQPGHNYRSALEFTRKADVYAYEHRKIKKRLFRALWITRLGAALRQRGISYNRFIPALQLAGITLNRKMLSEIAIADPATFDAIVEATKPHIVGTSRGNDSNSELRMPLPDVHRRFLDAALPALKSDARLLGVAVAGSGAHEALDEWSDLDLLIVADPQHYDAVMNDRRAIAERLSPLIASFIGEHVGEPRLLICLYELDESLLLHVDLKFIKPEDCRTRVDDPQVLWERTSIVSETINSCPSKYPPLEPQWAEDRFWTWIHYAATKIGRGERFEALEGLSFLRVVVIAPLAQQQAGFEPRSVRRIEEHAPKWMADLRATIAISDEPRELIRAYRELINLYINLRDNEKVEGNGRAQAAAIRYFDHVDSIISR